MASSIDWHSADIIAAIKKQGTTLAAVSREAGLSSSTLANALTRPWPKGEIIIAKAIGVEPQLIWPSRYQNLKQGQHSVRELKMKKLKE